MTPSSALFVGGSGVIPDPITYTWFLETPRFNAANGISIGSADSAVTTPHARDRRTHTHTDTHTDPATTATLGGLGRILFYA